MSRFIAPTALLAIQALAGSTQPWHGPHQGSPPYGYSTSSATAPASTPSCGYSGGAPTATIEAGVLIGTTTSLPTATASVNKFLGIPFAQSPPTRFAPPESPGTFSAPINATAWSPACIQQFEYPLSSAEFIEDIFNSAAPAESEDCLYLNVYAPSTPAPADGRAVLFYIYGGSLQFGKELHEHNLQILVRRNS